MTKRVGKPRRTAIVKSDYDSSSLAVAYHRGFRYLEERRLACCDDPQNVAVQPDRSLTHFGKGSIGRQIVERLAKTMGIDMDALRDDAKLAHAVETIVSNCGQSALGVMLNSDRPQSRDAIMKLSRKSRERQQYRINGVAEGKFRTVAPQSSDSEHVPDTKDFAKILSRLARARGSIEASREVLESRNWRRLPTTLARLISTCQLQTSEHLRLLKTLRDTTTSVPKKRAAPNQTQHQLKFDDLPRQLASALSFIRKNVDNIQTSSYDLRPTREQRSSAETEIVRIGGDCIRIIRLLKKAKRSKR